jgi:hypothetical protein
LQVLSGYLDPMATGGVAVWAHVGGFVAGVLLIKLFENRDLTSARWRQVAAGAASGRLQSNVSTESADARRWQGAATTE